MASTRVYKVIMIGDAGVGKTCLAERFVNSVIPSNVMPTVGHEFFQKIITLKNGSEVVVQIWDTAGQEKYRAMTMGHYKGAQAAVLVFDLTNEASFKNTLTWLSEFQTNASANAKVCLVGNKLDLVEVDAAARCMDKKAGQNMADINKIHYFETSAAVDKNVTEAFNTLIQGTR